MPNLITLFFTLSLLSIPTSSHEDEFFFNGFHDAGANITLSQSSIFLKNGILRLTNETSRLMGHAFYTNPLQFKNTSNGKAYSFSTCFAIAIVPEYPKLGGHGLAFALSSSNNLNTALPSQYLGLLNSSDFGNVTNHLFAIEFDTVQDFEFGDINDNHVGIDINSLVSNQSANATYIADDMSKRDLYLKSGDPIMVWIDYDSVNMLINVTISPSSAKPMLPILSYKCDLSKIINENMFVGFSASTGLLASSHYVSGWSFKMNGEAKSLSLGSLPKPPQPKKKQTALILGVSLSSFIVLFSLILISLYLIWKYKNRDVVEDWELESTPHRYSYQELKKATKGFKNSELLGVGGFGSVYKGTLANSNTQIAVKKVSHDSKQGLREFVSEISSIGKLRHRNLVQLIGWCRRRGDLLLVYEFMPNGSLDRFLFYETENILNWEQRFKIIKGVAYGLLYLHEGYEQVVIHRDVKASNVLLDGDLNGKLGDFGLARLYEHGSNPGTTRVVGTLGYLAPEIPRMGKVTVKSDVFGFGAFLLEVVCGRRPIEPKLSQEEEPILVDWAWEKLKNGNVLDVVDPKMGEFDENEVVMVLRLGLMCSNEVALDRPSMREVVRYLEGEIRVPYDLREPYGGKGDGEVVFDDFVNSFASSSFDKSPCSFRREVVSTSFGSVSTSPTSLLFNTR